MQIDIYSQAGTKKGKVSLDATMFEANVNEGLIYLAVQRQLGCMRSSNAYTKTKGDVRGGGRKPWKQKGTGRARTGMIRNPHWRGGGVTFGPRGNRNFDKQMTKKMRRSALFSALSSKAADKAIVGLDKYEVDTPKTKDFAAFLTKLGADKRTLVVSATNDPMLLKSTNNLQKVKTISAQYLNVMDIINADKIIFLQDALTAASDIFVTKK